MQNNKITALSKEQYEKVIKDISIDNDIEIPKEYISDSVYSLEELSDDMLITLIKKDSSIFQYIKNPSDDVIKVALKANGLNLRFVKNQTKDHHYIAINSIPSAFRWCIKPNNNAIRLALSLSGMNLQYVKTSDYDTYQKYVNIAIDNNAFAIQFIDIPTDTQIKRAIIKNPKVIMSAISKSILKESHWRLAIYSDPSVILAYDTPSPDTVIMAIKKDPFLIELMDPKFITEEVIQYAIGINPKVIRHLNNVTYEMYISILKKDPSLIEEFDTDIYHLLTKGD